MQTQINNILVPVNMEAYAHTALLHAAEIAAETGAAIHLLHVIDNNPLQLLTAPENIISLPFFEDTAKQEKIKTLQHWKNEIEQYCKCAVEVLVKEGNIPEQIAAYANANNIDLVILGTRQKKNWVEKMQGSIAEQLTSKTSMLVMMVMHTLEAATQWKNIIVPVTGSIPEKRINIINLFAKKFQVKIHFVALENENKKNQQSHFDLLLRSLKAVKMSGNIPVDCRMLPGHNLSEAIWNYAKETQADAIMINPAERELQKHTTVKQLISRPWR